MMEANVSLPVLLYVDVFAGSSCRQLIAFSRGGKEFFKFINY